MARAWKGMGMERGVEEEEGGSASGDLSGGTKDSGDTGAKGTGPTDTRESSVEEAEAGPRSAATGRSLGGLLSALTNPTQLFVPVLPSLRTPAKPPRKRRKGSDSEVFLSLRDVGTPQSELAEGDETTSQHHETSGGDSGGSGETGEELEELFLDFEVVSPIRAAEGKKDRDEDTPEALESLVPKSQSEPVEFKSAEEDDLGDDAGQNMVTVDEEEEEDDDPYFAPRRAKDPRAPKKAPKPRWTTSWRPSAWRLTEVDEGRLFWISFAALAVASFTTFFAGSLLTVSDHFHEGRRRALPIEFAKVVGACDRPCLYPQAHPDPDQAHLNGLSEAGRRQAFAHWKGWAVPDLPCNRLTCLDAYETVVEGGRKWPAVQNSRWSQQLRSANGSELERLRWASQINASFVGSKHFHCLWALREVAAGGAELLKNAAPGAWETEPWSVTLDECAMADPDGLPHLFTLVLHLWRCPHHSEYYVPPEADAGPDAGPDAAPPDGPPRPSKYESLVALYCEVRDPATPPDPQHPRARLYHTAEDPPADSGLPKPPLRTFLTVYVEAKRPLDTRLVDHAKLLRYFHTHPAFQPHYY